MRYLHDQISTHSQQQTLSEHEFCTYASCKKVRPRVYWLSFAALRKGKNLDVFGTAGVVACRSKLAYGNVMSTWELVLAGSARVNLMLGCVNFRFSCVVSLTQYTSSVLFHISPNVSSKARQDSIGRYIKGWVESIKVGIGDDSKVVVDRFAKVETTVCKSTTMSRVISAAKPIDMLLA